MFFVLLLLFVARLAKASEIQEAGVEEIASLRERVETLEEMIAEASEDPGEDFRELIRSTAQFRSDQRALDEARSALQAVEDERNDLADQLADLLQTDGALEASAILARLSEAERIIATLRGENENLIGQVRHLSGRGGLDYPPCWIDPETGRTEYLFTVSLLGGELTVREAWPDSRTAEIQAIDGAFAALGTNLSRTEFGDRAMRVLAWAKRQRPECRHYVIIDDSSPDLTKSAFKADLLLVEEYFYKLLSSG